MSLYVITAMSKSWSNIVSCD